MAISSILNLVQKQQENFEIREARNGSPIPVVNDIHLHSAYNPEREAKAFIDKYEETLKNNSRILLLGFGLGYHLIEIETFLYEHHGEGNYHIIVIEPNNLLIEEAQRLKRLPVSKYISYYVTTNIDKLYQQRELVEFLVEHPGIVMHTASFNLNRKYYELFLSHKALSTVFESKNLPLNLSVSDFLSNVCEDSSFIELAKNIRKSDSVQGMDHLILGIDGIKKGIKSREEREGAKQ